MATKRMAHAVRRNVVLVVWLSGMLVNVTATAEELSALFNQQGYRLPPYRTLVTAPLPGVTALDDGAFNELVASPPVILVDVYMLTWHDGMFLQDRPHLTIPGSTWLPNVGSPALAEEWIDYFSDALDALREQTPAAPLVFFCRADCWLAWNAARRAQALGYEEVYWYANGVDGWQASGGALAAACPQLPAHAEWETCGP
ncbi:MULTISPECIES: rhodanese-like domain-containing protein [unclassified Halomonas]|uniref:rhodanese-like domain-containing protein n=1 Tax=unclassified Halomonas TaxID=2609666 RepID=UPI0009906E85|nr:MULTISPECIES: rhodanese-like domain-containing protein [unclassified Halomonas]AVU11161.1 sulfurtransferase [Halomonas sp. 'Soap Lake \